MSLPKRRSRLRKVILLAPIAIPVLPGDRDRKDSVAVTSRKATSAANRKSLKEAILTLHERLEDVDQAIRSIGRLGNSSNEQPAKEKAEPRPQAQKAEAVGTSLSEDTTERLRLDTELLQAQRIEAIGRFTGEVAREFNDILTVILGYSGLFLSELEPSDPMRSYAEEVKIAGGRAASLTKQLLAFSRTQVIAPTVSGLNRHYSRIREDAATAH
jgi:signal transduction histidine kinase